MKRRKGIKKKKKSLPEKESKFKQLEIGFLYLTTSFLVNVSFSTLQKTCIGALKAPKCDSYSHYLIPKQFRLELSHEKNSNSWYGRNLEGKKKKHFFSFFFFCFSFPLWPFFSFPAHFLTPPLRCTLRKRKFAGSNWFILEPAFYFHYKFLCSYKNSNEELAEKQIWKIKPKRRWRRRVEFDSGIR